MIGPRLAVADRCFRQQLLVRVRRWRCGKPDVSFRRSSTSLKLGGSTPASSARGARAMPRGPCRAYRRAFTIAGKKLLTVHAKWIGRYEVTALLRRTAAARVCLCKAAQKAGFNDLVEGGKVSFDVRRKSRQASGGKSAGEMRIDVRTLVAIMIMVLMATSSAFARKASQHHSKRAAPNHHSTTKTDPGGVARDPNDIELDRKIGSICRGWTLSSIERSGVFAGGVNS